jgi:hypothetical protein
MHVNDIYKKIDDKKHSKYKTYQQILEHAYTKIKSHVKINEAFCIFRIPPFLFGKPLYDVDEAGRYVRRELRKGEFFVEKLPDHCIYISWVRENKEKSKNRYSYNAIMPEITNIKQIMNNFS